MFILINGKRAVLKKGSSFEFISENRYFTGSDSYTLTITFPLRGCKENMEIFGKIHRKDVSKDRIIFDCEIHDRSFVKSGIVTVTEISESEVKTQFLEGLSRDNYLETLEDIYINELELGYPQNISPSDVPCSDACRSIDAGGQYVALPWVNNSSGNIQNKMEYNSANQNYEWASDCHGISYQPYLLNLTKRICTAIGYTFNFTAWENSNYRHLIVCNILPYTWFGDDGSQSGGFGSGTRSGGFSGGDRSGVTENDFSRSLPHWSVIEFFEELEHLLYGAFDINHTTKHITFGFNSSVLASAGSVVLDKIVDEYSAEITTEDEDREEYIETSNMKYDAQEYDEWNLMDCNWYIESVAGMDMITPQEADTTSLQHRRRGVIEYATVSAMLADQIRYRTLTVRRANHYSHASKLMYCDDVGMYFIFKCIYMTPGEVIIYQTYNYHYMIVPLNQFGEKVVVKDNDQTKELKIVPARIDFTEESLGECIFVDVPSFNDSEELDESNLDDGDNMEAALSEIQQSKQYERVIRGKKEESTEYYSYIQVAFWDGTNYNPGYLPRPIIDKVTTTHNWTSISTQYSLRLNEGGHTTKVYDIDAKKKYTFKFLSDAIPDVRSLFYIHGQKYICKKITATFAEESGMSQLLKMECFKVKE